MNSPLTTLGDRVKVTDFGDFYRIAPVLGHGQFDFVQVHLRRIFGRRNLTDSGAIGSVDVPKTGKTLGPPSVDFDI